MITNESGLTYHYSLPVYAYYQVNKAFETGKESSVFQRNSENHPYAYTWYLTAVTGSDYVNRNSVNDGTIGNQDWGYWVKFTYQLQTNSFIWRNPTVGTHRDIDQKIESYSYGQKELFYLDKIQTQSHIVVFEKSARVDGRGVNNGITGSFNQSSVTNCYTDPNCNPADCADPDPRACDGYCQICETTPVLAAKTLRLDKIYLLTMADYLQAGTLLSKSLRVISFNTDYSLALGTLNSFSDSNVASKLGKLTLNSVTFLGKGGSDLTPPISFSYAKNPDFDKDKFDIWGSYKSDFNNSLPENIARSVSTSSSENVDAWSLTKIKTSLGSSIEVGFETDKYTNVALQKQQLLRIQDASLENGNLRVIFFDAISQVSSDLLNHKSDLVLTGSYKFSEASSIDCGSCQLNSIDPNCLTVNYPYKFKGEVIVLSTDLSNNSMLLQCPEIINQIQAAKSIYWEYKATSLCYNCSNASQISCTFNFTGAKSLPKFYTGGFFTTGNYEKFGGGLRVKFLRLSSDVQVRSTNYSYFNGTTSYEPFEILPSLVNPAYAQTVSSTLGVQEVIKMAAVDYYSKSISIAREIPAPGVIYEKVTVTEEIKRAGETSTTQLPGSKVYEFQVFDENIVERLGITTIGGLYPVECFDSSGNLTYCGPPPPNPGPPPIFCKDQNGNTISCNIPPGTGQSPITLKDFSSWVGNLKSFTTYGPNNEILEKTTNQYLHDGKTNDQFIQDLKLKFNSQGIITQTFNENRMPVGYVFSRRDEFPLVAIGQTTTNYKTGITISSQNLAFDFYTGDPLKVLHTDGYGNKYVSETLPAYSLDSYSGMTSAQVLNGFVGMGLKVNNPKNKHMLTQVVRASTFKVNDNFVNTKLNSDKLALVSASAQTWSDQVTVLTSGSAGANAPQAGVWRQRSSYNFIGDENVALRTDGLYPFANFNEFTDWTGNTVTPNWQKLSEIKLFDTYSHALEATDLNGNFAATKMSLDQTRVFSTASNAQYNEFAFSGLEENVGQNSALGGGVKLNGTTVSGTAHTGSFSASAILNTKGFSYTFNNTTAKKYHVAVWANRSDAVLKLNTTIIQTNFTQAGSWYLIEGDIDIAVGSNFEISCEARNATTLFDDFRVHPLKAAMVSYVYSKWGELTHILDNNNLFTEYEYDGMGRLTKVYKETFLHGRTKTSETVYHYAN